ncbi:MAG: hypothetical protein AB1627_06345 [Chloroflexota bacterium]
MQRWVAILVFLALAVGVAACGGGGGGGATTAPGDGAASEPPAATVPAQASAPAATDAPAATTAGGGGGPTGSVCDLATADELAGVFGTPVTVTVFAGPPDTCMAEDSEKRVLVSWVLTTQDAATIYAALTDGARDVPGIGDRAAFVDNVGLLVLKGDRLVSITISGMAELDGAAAEAAATEVGRAIANRL